eukprot:9929373-Heterocapsa_arctica.AAC.1
MRSFILYVNEISLAGSWGGMLELRAAADFYNCDLALVTPDQGNHLFRAPAATPHRQMIWLRL